ncbi:MAG: NAD(P)H-binding protein [Pseudomonadota bacterium]
MKLVVLGANGRTGKLVVQAALERGMEVTAVVRSAKKMPANQNERLTVLIGNPCDKKFLKHVLHGQDAVISALGGRKPTRAATSVYYRSADALVDAAWETGLRRILVTSTALLFDGQTVAGKILCRLVPNVVGSARRMEDILKASHLNWTSARPGFLSDGDGVGYRAQKNKLPKNGTSVTRRALARFLIDAVESPETDCAVFGVSNEIA